MRNPRNDDVSEDDDTSQSAESVEETFGAAEINLNLAHLQSLHQFGEARHQSTFAVNGASTRRMKAVLANPPCNCGCTVPFQQLKKVCTTFWSLPKEAQDALLWSLQSRAGPGSSWHIEGPRVKGKSSFVSVCLDIFRPGSGHQICREAFVKYMGVGKERLLRTKRRHRGLDERRLNTGAIAQILLTEPFLHSFLTGLSIKEPTIQHKLRVAIPSSHTSTSRPVNPCQTSCVDDFISNILELDPDRLWFDITSRFESKSTESRSRNDDELREELLRKLIDRKLFGPSQQILDLDPGTLPARELPPGRTSGLYLMFLAYLRASNRGADSTPPSKSTFYATAQRWAVCLKFRRKSDHTMCATCQSLKAAIHQASDLSSVEL